MTLHERIADMIIRTFSIVGYDGSSLGGDGAAKEFLQEAIKDTIAEVLPGLRDEGGDIVIDSQEANFAGFVANPNRVILRFGGFDVYVSDEIAADLGKQIAVRLLSKEPDLPPPRTKRERIARCKHCDGERGCRYCDG